MLMIQTDLKAKNSKLHPAGFNLSRPMAGGGRCQKESKDPIHSSFKPRRRHPMHNGLEEAAAMLARGLDASSWAPQSEYLDGF
eukprot:scaffold3499_cov247-Pinguiococcus_pyrenoidosus.AAC.7